MSLLTLTTTIEEESVQDVVLDDKIHRIQVRILRHKIGTIVFTENKRVSEELNNHIRFAEILKEN